ncbi:MAG: MerR family transcriptional regulator [Hyphomicrobiales bacterium]|nr:MerR family transcriptional regulator [Hyphomicrobiales bacterium]MDE2114034.1 MerR family transcriptional regulator [Hyphomicrobiales bacterium]
MEKNEEAFRTIGEVGDDLGLPHHVLRFWETRFIQIKPLKRGGGRRYYRPDDVELVRAIQHLLYAEGYTIKGVQRILKERGLKALIAASRAMRASGGTKMLPGEPHPTGSNEPTHIEEANAFGADEPESEVMGLSEGDIGILNGALRELDECMRLLASARAS